MGKFKKRPFKHMGRKVMHAAGPAPIPALPPEPRPRPRRPGRFAGPAERLPLKILGALFRLQGAAVPLLRKGRRPAQSFPDETGGSHAKARKPNPPPFHPECAALPHPPSVTLPPDASLLLRAPGRAFRRVRSWVDWF